MQRRSFIKAGCTACLSFTAIATLMNSCTPTRYISGELNKDGLLVSKEDFKVKQSGGTAYSSFIIVRNESLKFPICIYRFSEQDYTAIWMKCAHQGAELQAAGDKLQCPAHGSEFDNKGNVTNGPATGNLKTFPVKIMNDALFIDLRKQA